MLRLLRFASLTTLLCGAMLARADTNKELLQPDEAFALSASIKNATKLALTWNIADGYYLYRDKIRFTALSKDEAIGPPLLPAGAGKHDQFFGAVEIYRGELVAELPLAAPGGPHSVLMLEVSYQGCADQGVCYLPITKTVTVDFAEDNVKVADGLAPPLGE